MDYKPGESAAVDERARVAINEIAALFGFHTVEAESEGD